ncbi:MAG: alcohol dehydrogenase catalytic domain-containing protein [bacterium]
MRAVVKTKREKGSVQVIDVCEPFIGDDYDVIVAVKAAAICGSDIHAYEYLPSYEFMKVPVILGHEFSGIVIDVGPKVTKFKYGDKVMGESNLYCGVCPNCLTGNTNICYSSKMRGLHIDGCMSQLTRINEKFLHHIPDNISFSEAAAAQACTISLHAMLETEVFPGDNVVIFGPGIVGHTVAQILKLRGANEVFLVGTNKDEAVRLKAAEDIGLRTININKSNVKDEIKNICKMDTADTVIECSGSATAFNEGIHLLKRGGQLVIVGIYADLVTVPLTYLVRNQIRIRTSYTSTWYDYEKTLELLGKQVINIKQLCTEYLLDDVESAFNDAIEKKVIKPVLIIN